MTKEMHEKNVGSAGVSSPPRFIFTYNTQHLLYKDKVRFYYALKGRDGKSGIMKKADIEQIARTVLLVRPENAGSVERFLKEWNCVFKRQRILLLPDAAEHDG